jgi:hypothetical protein
VLYCPRFRSFLFSAPCSLAQSGVKPVETPAQADGTLADSLRAFGSMMAKQFHNRDVEAVIAMYGESKTRTCTLTMASYILGRANEVDARAIRRRIRPVSGHIRRRAHGCSTRRERRSRLLRAHDRLDRRASGAARDMDGRPASWSGRLANCPLPQLDASCGLSSWHRPLSRFSPRSIASRHVNSAVHPSTEVCHVCLR